MPRLWASLANFGNIILLIPALVIYLVFKDRGPGTRVEGKEALNWTINITGLVIILEIVSSIFAVIPFIGFIFWTLLQVVLWLLLVLNLIFAIIAGVRVNAGGSYRYPVNVRWIK